MKKLSDEAMLLQNRTSFALFIKKGIDEVERLYPASVSFVKENKGKKLKEVTGFLSEQLQDHNKR